MNFEVGRLDIDRVLDGMKMLLTNQRAASIIEVFFKHINYIMADIAADLGGGHVFSDGSQIAKLINY